MAWKSRQMRTDAVRASVEAISDNLLTRLKEKLRGITWDNASHMLVSNQEYGNTKFSDLWIIMCFLKEHMFLIDASRRIGYRAYYNGWAIRKRMERINTIHFLTVAEAMLYNGLLDHQDLFETLRIRRGGSKFHRFFAKQLVLSAIETNGSRKLAAETLRVEELIINYWANLKVEDPRINVG